jgi:hypothetical protein
MAFVLCGYDVPAPSGSADEALPEGHGIQWIEWIA